MIGARGFLKREGFEFDKKPTQIDKAFLKLFSKTEVEEIKQTWQQIHMFGASATKLYSYPKTLEQAHMLMSYDRERYLVGFDWIARRVETLKPEAVLEVGTGTGVLMRYLAANFPCSRYHGIDIEAGLIGAAPIHEKVSLQAGDYLKMEAKPEFDLIICNFGFDNDTFPSSKTPHSIAQVGETKFCPGCSDDLASHLQQYFRSWRDWAKGDASLLMVGRIPNFGFLRAVVLAASAQGWTLKLDESTVLKVKEPEVGVQRYPALQFRTLASTSITIEDVERFYAA